MAFAVSDFNDLKRLLAQHPDWCAELRHLLLTEDFEALPAIVRELAEAQRRTEQRLEELAEAQRRTEQRLEELAEAQRRTEQRLEELAEAQRRTEQRVEELAEAQRRSEERLTRLETRVDRIEIKLGRVDGRTLESSYRDKAPAYFGRWLRRTKVVDGNELLDRIESHIGADELDEVLQTDLVICGRAAQEPSRPEVWLAVEVSAVIDREDVARAVRRAQLLRRAGLPALPVVAGECATEGAEAEARDRGVAMLQDGSGLFWDEARSAWPI